MNCFYHPEKNAIGLCKHCQKGLCLDCTTDLGYGLACKDKHEAEVEAVHGVVQKNVELYSKAPGTNIIAPLFYLFMGVVFAGFGYTSYEGVKSLAFIMGVGFIVFALVIYFRNRALFKNEPSA